MMTRFLMPFGGKMDFRRRLLSFFSISLFALNVQAFPITSEKPWQWLADEPLTQTQSQSGFSRDGIVALPNCSGSFVKFRNTSEDAKGMILTNGHCLGNSFGGGFPKPGEAIVNKPKKLNVRLLKSDMSTLGNLRVEKIIYGTMTVTDAALLGVSQTYREIERSFGVRPLVISENRPQRDTEIEVPSGYWRRIYLCRIEAFVPTLREAGWTFKDSIRYSSPGCEVVGGTSGSPIVSRQTGEVIGVNNTGNESGKRCTMNNPCEVDENGQVSVIKGRGYGQQTYILAACVGANGVFDLTQKSCTLPGR